MGIHWDGTITLGNILTFAVLLIAIVKFFGAQAASREARVAYERDLEWRIGNLETWRKEHMIDSDARDKLLQANGKILDNLDFLRRERERDNEGRRRPREGQY